MTDVELLYQAIAEGGEDNALIAACLDAHCEQPAGTLLGACLEVARIWHARKDALALAEAAKILKRRSPLRRALIRTIVGVCLGADEDANAQVTLVAGEEWPVLLGDVIPLPRLGWTNQHISVGAEWVLKRAEAIRENLAKDGRTARTRRSR